MISSHDFPQLTAENHRVTSPASAEYNCIAWAVGDEGHWWQPGVYWPAQVTAGDFGLVVLMEAFLVLNFVECDTVTLEPGYEKVALYADSTFYTHAARQLPSGKWTSKLGKDIDIEHDATDDVAGGVYGAVAKYMKRPVEKESTHPT